MKTIFKYSLATASRQAVRMPAMAQILSVQVQRGTICLWAQVDPALADVERSFVILGTGHPIPEGSLEYLDSVQQGDFVWHIFEAR